MGKAALLLSRIKIRFNEDSDNPNIKSIVEKVCKEVLGVIPPNILIRERNNNIQITSSNLNKDSTFPIFNQVYLTGSGQIINNNTLNLVIGYSYVLKSGYTGQLNIIKIIVDLNTNKIIDSKMIKHQN